MNPKKFEKIMCKGKFSKACKLLDKIAGMDIKVRFMADNKSLDDIFFIRVIYNWEFIEYEHRVKHMDFISIYNWETPLMFAKLWRELIHMSYDLVVKKWWMHVMNKQRYTNMIQDLLDKELSRIKYLTIPDVPGWNPPKETWRLMTAMEYWVYFKLETIRKIPEDVLEALDIQQTAQRNQIEILKQSQEIKRRKQDYFKKHWTYTQKAKAYLEWFFT